MLTLNPRNRITAVKALGDPWLTDNHIETKLNKNIIDNLNSFQVPSPDLRAKPGSATPSSPSWPTCW